MTWTERANIFSLDSTTSSAYQHIPELCDAGIPIELGLFGEGEEDRAGEWGMGMLEEDEDEGLESEDDLDRLLSQQIGYLKDQQEEESSTDQRSPTSSTTPSSLPSSTSSPPHSPTIPLLPTPTPRHKPTPAPLGSLEGSELKELQETREGQGSPISSIHHQSSATSILTTSSSHDSSDLYVDLVEDSDDSDNDPTPHKQHRHHQNQPSQTSKDTDSDSLVWPDTAREALSDLQHTFPWPVDADPTFGPPHPLFTFHPSRSPTHQGGSHDRTTTTTAEAGGSTSGSPRVRTRSLQLPEIGRQLGFPFTLEEDDAGGDSFIGGSGGGGDRNLPGTVEGQQSPQRKHKALSCPTMPSPGAREAWRSDTLSPHHPYQLGLGHALTKSDSNHTFGNTGGEEEQPQHHDHRPSLQSTTSRTSSTPSTSPNRARGASPQPPMNLPPLPVGTLTSLPSSASSSPHQVTTPLPPLPMSGQGEWGGKVGGHLSTLPEEERSMEDGMQGLGFGDEREFSGRRRSPMPEDQHRRHHQPPPSFGGQQHRPQPPPSSFKIDTSPTSPPRDSQHYSQQPLPFSPAETSTSAPASSRFSGRSGDEQPFDRRMEGRGRSDSNGESEFGSVNFGSGRSRNGNQQYPQHAGQRYSTMQGYQHYQQPSYGTQQSEGVEMGHGQGQGQQGYGRSRAPSVTTVGSGYTQQYYALGGSQFGQGGGGGSQRSRNYEGRSFASSSGNGYGQQPERNVSLGATSGGESKVRRPSLAKSDGSDTPHPFSASAVHSSFSNHGNSGSAVRDPMVLQQTVKVAPHQVTLVSEEDMAAYDEEVCPICVESLANEYRLPGEKAHVTPACGHSLHHECFVTVYGPVPISASARRNANFGVCGVCRKAISLEEEDEFGPSVQKTSSKFAAITGMDGGNGGRPNSVRGFAETKRGLPSSATGSSFSSTSLQLDNTGDDPLDPPFVASSSRSIPSIASDAHPQVVIPAFTLKSEYTSISRKAGRNGKQMLTCMVTIEVPSVVGHRAKYPAPPPMPINTSDSGFGSGPSSALMPKSATMGNLISPLSLAPSSLDTSRTSPRPPLMSGPDPFAHISEDLKNRMVDWKTSGLENIGSIKLYDILKVRKGSFVLEICVYLFQHALVCVSEEKRKGLRGLLSGSTSTPSLRSFDGEKHKRDKGVLRLKGRIYIRHVRRIIDSTVQNELSLTITMEDENLDSFILSFKDRSSHEKWRSTLVRLLEETKGEGFNSTAVASPSSTPSGAGGKLAKMGIQESAISMLQSSASTLSPDGSRSQGFSPVTSYSEGRHPRSPEFQMMSPGPQTSKTSSTLATSPNFSLPPLAPVHTPLDLLIVISVPPVTSNSSSSTLKIKLIRQSLEFVCALLGPKDRLSVVTFEAAAGGKIRKTPFLSPGRIASRNRLEQFLSKLGEEPNQGLAIGIDELDEFSVEVGKDERPDVVSGVNVGLDVVMQRKVKNPLTGMLLISDTVDTIKRAQMDLVLARAEAANVPIHTFGYGKNQDPSALWLISSHTSGTYTFVKEWYDLRDCIAGVIGGLLSIAVTNMKIHLGSVDTDFKCRKISGASGVVLSSNGKNVDIELRELRHGQKLELLVEMEVQQRYHGDDGLTTAGHSSAGGIEGSSDEDQSSPLDGIKKSSLFTDSSSSGKRRPGGAEALIMMSDDDLIDEVPVFDLDCAYHDPAVGRSVARLSHLILLTVAILPTRSEPATPLADHAIIRRRYELLASESITRCLLLISRKNWSQAQRLMQETTRILNTMIGQLSSSVGHGGGSQAKARKDAVTRSTVESLNAVLGDIDYLQEGIEEHKDLFDRDHRNFGAQQGMVLRTQKSWTLRTSTEKLYCTEGSREAIGISQEWAGR